jgi:hypothetical protein
MSKPIFIVRLPAKKYEPDMIDGIQKRFNTSNISNDYHILVMADEFTGGETKFECYNAPHTEMKFEELQRRVLMLIDTDVDAE